MSDIPLHYNCPCGRPDEAHSLPGVWRDDEVGHYFFISCAECGTAVSAYFSSAEWNLVDQYGLEWTEEYLEDEAKYEWNAKSKCPHIVFIKEAR